MNLFINLVPLVTGIFLVFSALIMITENIVSHMLLKMILFLLGLSNLFVAIKLFGWM